MPERHLPPNKDEAVAIVKKSVGRIIGTQKLFENFYNSHTSSDSAYSKFPPILQQAIPDAAPAQLKWQYFSDGLVVYIPLGSGLVASPASSLFELLIASGMLCLLGLAAQSPVRIGIDAAWAVEYRPNELYGSALAHAYKLESEVAQWPRVVVGEGLVGYLQHYATDGDNSISSQIRREMGAICLKLLTIDIDGNHIVDYLGEEYRLVTKGTLDKPTIAQAQLYAENQITHWRNVGDMKLVQRYEFVCSYFSSRMSEI